MLRVCLGPLQLLRRRLAPSECAPGALAHRHLRARSNAWAQWRGGNGACDDARMVVPLPLSTNWRCHPPPPDDGCHYHGLERCQPYEGWCGRTQGPQGMNDGLWWWWWGVRMGHKGGAGEGAAVMLGEGMGGVQRKGAGRLRHEPAPARNRPEHLDGAQPHGRRLRAHERVAGGRTRVRSWLGHGRRRKGGGKRVLNCCGQVRGAPGLSQGARRVGTTRHTTHRQLCDCTPPDGAGHMTHPCGNTR